MARGGPISVLPARTKTFTARPRNEGMGLALVVGKAVQIAAGTGVAEVAAENKRNTHALYEVINTTTL